MQPKITTRRTVLIGVGAAGVAGAVGGSSTALASEHDDATTETDPEMDDDDRFAAVRVGNLVPDIIADQSENGSPGRGPPMDTPGRSGSGPSAPQSAALDLYVGKPPDRNPTIGWVNYPTFGPGPGDGYLQVPARSYDIWVARSGTIDPTLETTLEVNAGHR